MELNTQSDVKSLFKILEDLEFDIPGVYSPAEKVIESKINKIIRSCNTKNLEIDCDKIRKELQLNKIESFNEITMIVEEYFSGFGTEVKLNQMYDKLRFVSKYLRGEEFVNFQKTSLRKSDCDYGVLVDFSKSIKLSIGDYMHFKSSDQYLFSGGLAHQVIHAASYLVKHFFDVEMSTSTTFSGDKMGQWVEYPNGLSVRVFKNGTLELKHKHIDILMRDIEQYYNSKYKNHFFKS